MSSGDSESLVVVISVQLRIAFLAMTPEMTVGSLFETKDSVRAREVASVPPR